MKPERGSTLIEALTCIWERLLQRSPIGADENFFDLGGDSSAAVSLFREIAKVLGRELPPVMVYQAPTIALLAAALESPTAPKFPPLVLLKPGVEQPAIFLMHGLGGNVLSFFHVVKHIDSAHPIYGMQAKGIDGLDEPFDRVEDMAEFFLEAMKKVQPHGPYLLVGYSFGGLVALEIAKRLSGTGEKVGLLAMLETYPHKRYLALAERLRLRARVTKHHVTTVMNLGVRKAVGYVASSAERSRYRPGEGGGSEPNQAPVHATYTAVKHRMRDRGYVALERYRPSFYCGKIKFVKAEIRFAFPDDPASFWRNLAEEVEVETVPGDHHGILRMHPENLAAVLSRYIREATNPK